MNKLNFFLALILAFSSVSSVSAQMTVPGPPVNTKTQLNASNAQVRVPGNLYSAAITLAKSNDNITKIDIDNGWVHVSYKYRTKLFWLIPVNVHLKASASLIEKQLQLGRPWWSLFAPVPTRLFKEALQTNFNKITLTTDEDTNLTRVMNVMVSTMSKVSAEN